MSTWIALIVFIIIVLVVWWALLRNAATYRPDFEVHPHDESHPVQEQPVVETEIAPVRLAEIAPTEPLKPDDLTILEGIGPKTNKLLQEAGIQTFAQLAAMQVAEIKAILEPAGLQFMDPGSWAEQAQLAAEGKFDELKKLTDSLKGGRIVT